MIDGNYTLIIVSVKATRGTTPRLDRGFVERDGPVESHTKLAEETDSTNVKDSDVLIRKDATREDLESIAEHLNEFRGRIFDTMVEFHMAAKEHTTEEQ